MKKQKTAGYVKTTNLYIATEATMRIFEIKLKENFENNSDIIFRKILIFSVERLWIDTDKTKQYLHKYGQICSFTRNFTSKTTWKRI